MAKDAPAMDLQHVITHVNQYRFVVGFSGGKDSVASWLYLTRELKAKNVVCLFADVGHEFQETHDYLDLLEKEHGLPLVRSHATLADMQDGNAWDLLPEKICERLGIAYDGPDGVWRHEKLDMERMAILKKRFPSPSARFCTTILKLRPSRRWMQANHQPNTIRVCGVRAQESAKRAEKEPWSFDEWLGYQLWMPIFRLTHDEVFAMHKRHGVPVNPLYLMGMGRVGCAPCINARKAELQAIATRKPEAFAKLWEMEKRVAAAVGKQAMSFFSNNDAPKYHSERCEKTGKSFPNADDVRRWSLALPRADQHPMFEEDDTEDAYTCQSQYGLCE